MSYCEVVLFKTGGILQGALNVARTLDAHVQDCVEKQFPGGALQGGPRDYWAPCKVPDRRDYVGTVL